MLNRRFGLCVALVAVCSFAHGDSFIGGSSILHPGDVTTLSGWLGGGSLQLTKIFDMESGDGQTPYDFHLAADRNGPTISAFDVNVVTADEDEGLVIGDHFVIGGYDPQSWDSDNDWHTTSVLAGRTAFIFNLTTGTKQAQILTDGSDGPGAYQTSNTAYYYPIFGATLYPHLSLGRGGSRGPYSAVWSARATAL